MFDYYDSYVDPYPNVVKINTNFHFYEYIDWLNENIGEHWIDWDIAQDQRGTYHFRFKTEEDKVKFILRWL